MYRQKTEEVQELSPGTSQHLKVDDVGRKTAKELNGMYRKVGGKQGNCVSWKPNKERASRMRQRSVSSAAIKSSRLRTVT